jgi:hypothetical protein
MTLLEKSDAKNHRSVGRGKSLPAPRPRGRSGRNGCSKVKLEFASENTSPFAEDFYWEHSSASVSINLTAFSASSGPVGSVPPRNQYGDSFSSPSCVYLG